MPTGYSYYANTNAHTSPPLAPPIQITRGLPFSSFLVLSEAAVVCPAPCYTPACLSYVRAPSGPNTTEQHDTEEAYIAEPA